MKYVQIEGDTAIVSVEDYFTLIKVLPVDAELNEAYDKGCHKVIVDFAKTKYVDSSCITELITIVRKVGTENFEIRNVAGKVATALRGANLLGWVKDRKNG